MKTFYSLRMKIMHQKGVLFSLSTHLALNIVLVNIQSVFLSDCCYVGPYLASGAIDSLH